MGDKSKIIWTDATWNPITGCSRISAGCKNCYALRMARRQAHISRVTGHDNGYGFDPDHSFDVRFHPERLDQPLRWKKPRRIFVCSMADLFHNDVKYEWQEKVFDYAHQAGCDGHIFQFLTKRPSNMNESFSRWLNGGICGAGPFCCEQHPQGHRLPYSFHIGVTAENQEQADKRIPLLLETPAAKRFLSIEPMLSNISLKKWLVPKDMRDGYKQIVERFKMDEEDIPPHLVLKKSVDLVIVGGESGPGARPMHPGWVRSIRDQCIEAEVPFLFKQYGEWAPSSAFHPGAAGQKTKRVVFENCSASMYKIGRKKAGRELDGRTWDGVIE